MVSMQRQRVVSMILRLQRSGSDWQGVVGLLRVGGQGPDLVGVTLMTTRSGNPDLVSLVPKTSTVVYNHKHT